MLFRPFVSVEESVALLSPDDISAIGRGYAASVILKFLQALKGEKVDFTDDPLLEWYWNNGKPYFGDVFQYYTCSKVIAQNNSCVGYNLLKPVWKEVKSCEFIENYAPWSQEMGNVHKFLLLDRHHFWYQRFFLDIRYKMLKDMSFMDGKKPRSLKDTKIGSATYEITV